MESRSPLWRAAASDDIGAFRLEMMPINGLLLVPVGVHIHAALLLEQRTIVFVPVECEAAEITFHKNPLEFVD